MKKIVKNVLAGSFLAGGLLAMGCQPPAASNNNANSKKNAGNEVVVPDADAVKVDFYVMSQCPFGKQVEDGIYPVLKELGTTVNFSLNYIGDARDGNFSSMHGENEVNGDKVQLCAAKKAPAKYMEMINCMNQNIRAIPNNWEECAGKAGIDVAAVKACYEGEEGKNLLATSFEAAQKIGARGSPTIKINGKDYQGGRSPDAFTRAICAAGSKAKKCAELPPPPEVKLTVLTDARCKQCGMQVARLQSHFSGMMPGLKASSVDYASEEGKKLYADNGLDRLPVFIFDSNVEKVDEMRRFIGRAKRVGDNRILEMGNFDPKAEICDNNIDDTGNGKVDCADETCQNTLICRQEVKGKLEVFVMSQCPYGVRALNAVKEVLDAIPSVDFHVNYIADGNVDNLSSMHGQAEVDEDIRELCAIKLYGKNNKFMDYVLCRNKNIRSADWKSCAVNGIDAAAMEKCINEEGKKLLADNLKIAKGLEIGASPTWIANNKFKFSGIDANSIKENWCSHNQGAAGCDKQLTQDAAPVQGGCGN